MAAVIADILFKLKHDIANDSELALACLELRSLLGMEPVPVRNLVDAAAALQPVRAGILEGCPSRVQDILLRLPYPGALQGYRCPRPPERLRLADLERLTYFRDLFVVCTASVEAALAELGVPTVGFRLSEQEASSPLGQRLSPLLSVHRPHPDQELYLLRMILPHSFLECSDHIVRLAQKPRDVDRMYDAMVAHLHTGFARPFAASVQMGFKWIEDFIDDRRPPNAYASHALFGLRGRFFPRMVRALANDLARDTGATCLVDPFCGVGTLGIECALLGLESRSYDVNPLFVRLSRAKRRALSLSESEAGEIEELRQFAQQLRLEQGETGFRGNRPSPFGGEPAPVPVALPPSASRSAGRESAELVGLLRAAIGDLCSPENAQVAELAIAYYAASMLRKYSPDKILRAFWAHLSRILYLHRFMARLYAGGIVPRPAPAAFEVGDVRRLSTVESEVPALFTSPPYTTAIDYVGNDLYGYYALGFDDHLALDHQVIGSTRLGRVSAEQAGRWDAFVPAAAREAHRRVAEVNPKKAQQLSKYFYEMTSALEQMEKTLAPGGRAIVVVCEEQRFGGETRIAYPVAEAIADLAAGRGLKLDRRLDVELTKNGDGGIQRECALTFIK